MGKSLIHHTHAHAVASVHILIHIIACHIAAITLHKIASSVGHCSLELLLLLHHQLLRGVHHEVIVVYVWHTSAISSAHHHIILRLSSHETRKIWNEFWLSLSAQLLLLLSRR